MPVHDWTRVDAGLFHDFHQGWTIALRDALNAGRLPQDYFALVDQSNRGPIPDVLTLQLASSSQEPENGAIGLAVATTPPRAHLVRESEADIYAARANRITVRHRHGEVVAVVEILSPGNKASRAELRRLVEKSAELIRQGVHMLIVDLFPPSPRDPDGIHKAIWDEFLEEECARPATKPLTVVSYDAGPPRVAYVGFLAVGDELPAHPLYLKPGYYVPAPLEESYQLRWEKFPASLKGLLDVD